METTDTTTPTAGALLQQFSQTIDAQDWAGLAALLAPGFEAHFAHTGETFDKDGFVAMNRDYPGSWRFEHEQIVDAGPEAVLRARVSDATGESDEVHYVATFAAAADGLLTGIVEVWGEVSTPDPDRR